MTMIAWPAKECNRGTGFENMTQCTKILKKIFTFEHEKTIDRSRIVVYYVCKQRTTGEKHGKFHNVFNGTCR